MMMTFSFRNVSSFRLVLCLVTLFFGVGSTGFASSHPIIWENLTNAEVSGGNLISTSNGWENVGANANEAFVGDGSVNFKVLSNKKKFTIGLGDQPGGTHHKTINYALHFSGTQVYVFQKGRNWGKYSSYVPGDTFQIARAGDKINYKKNNVTFYSNPLLVESSTPLLVDFTADQIGASVGSTEYLSMGEGSIVMYTTVTLVSPDAYQADWPKFDSSNDGVIYKIYNNGVLVYETSDTIWSNIPVGEEDQKFTIVGETEAGGYVGKSYFILPAEPDFDEDKVNDRYELEKYGATNVVSHPRPYMSHGVVTEVTNTWKKVYFSEVNTSLLPTVVVCSPVYTVEHAPVVPMVRNVTSDSFELCLVSAGQDTTVEPAIVTYIAAQDGWYYRSHGYGEYSGVHYIADILPADQISSIENMVPSNPGYWYHNPVMFGTVAVSSNAEPKFQSIFSHGSHQDLPPSTRSTYFGTHAGADTSGREPAEVHILHLSQGTNLVDGQFLDIVRTGPGIKGVDDGGSLFNIGKNAIDVALVALSGIRGAELSFPVVLGEQFNQPLINNELKIAVDRDTFSTTGRTSQGERVGLAFFSKEPPQPYLASSRVGDIWVMPSIGGKFKLQGVDGTKILYETGGAEPDLGSPVFKQFKVTENTTIKAITLQTWGDEQVSAPKTFEVLIADGVEDNISEGFLYRVYHPSGNQEILPNASELVGKLQQTHKSPLNMRPKEVGALTEVEAYLAVTETDYYTFTFAKTGGLLGELYLNDPTTPIASVSVTTDSGVSTSIYLEKGIYPLSIKTMSSSEGTEFSLHWKSSTRDELVPSSRLFHNATNASAVAALVDYDGDGVTDKVEASKGSDPHKIDSDGDGLDDYQEIMVYFTNPANVDSDGDDLSDYQEVIETGTNPNAFDSDGDGLNDYIETLAEGSYYEAFSVNGADFIDSIGEWKKVGGFAKSDDYNGTLEYDFTTFTDDMYFLNILAGGSRSSDIGKLYNLSVYVDGEYVNSLNVSDDVATRDNHFGMKFETSFAVDNEGGYSFKLLSEGGSQLFVNGELVVDNDGLHAATEAEGSVQLGVGTHSISIIYFEQESEELLEVSYSAPGGEFTKLTQARLTSQTHWWYYEGTWETLPTFSGMSVSRSGYSNGFDLSARKNQKRKTWYLPWLKAGDHKITVKWNNGIHDRKLRVDALIFNSLADADLNENGIKDWIDHKLSQECTVAEVTSSLTSPVCLEGLGKFTGMMAISNDSSVVKGVNDGWYSNVNLDVNGATEFNVSFQNGAKTEGREIQWSVTEIPEVESLTIRAGDSLLLAPGTEYASGEGTIIINGETFTVNEGESLPFSFDEPGTYTITSKYTVGGKDKDKKIGHKKGYGKKIGQKKNKKGKNKKVGHGKGNKKGHDKGKKNGHKKRAEEMEATLVVTVVGVQLPDQPFPSFLGKRATRNLMGILPEGVVAQPDSAISNWEPNNSVYVSYTVNSMTEKKVLTRLGENGPIIGEIKLQGILAAGMGQTTYYIDEIFEDGTYISNLVVVADPVTEGAAIDLVIFVTGVTFIDGSTHLILTKDDFDELGHFLVRMVKDRTVKSTANCHRMSLSHNGLFVHRR